MMRTYLILLLIVLSISISAQKSFDPELNLYIDSNKHNQQRSLRYFPQNEDIVIVNGKKKFNRALYGSHTGFRVETSDVPEFALYLPRMGGNLSFRIKNADKMISLNNADYVESRYSKGSRIYIVRDSLLKKAYLKMTVLAVSEMDGLIMKIEAFDLPKNVELQWTFGGAANKRFSREGDLGVDPEDSFTLKPEYCKNNEYTINGNSFNLTFGPENKLKLDGIFPEKSILSLNEGPVLDGKLQITSSIYYLGIFSNSQSNIEYSQLKTIFDKSHNDAVEIASNMKIYTPDPYINTLGSVFSTAADGIWDGTVWMHGAVGWRMPLPGWRAAYTGDVMGWHDRARTHFRAYAASQVKEQPAIYSHPYQDSALNSARSAKVWGTQMYSNGYIARNPNRNNQMHHYDMNLAYIDELLWHLQWTGDTEFMREIWPVIKSSLAWEKRNFDPDNDGLYDAYACIWASDALYYNSGAVTHSSAYNYRSNLLAAKIASKLGEDSKPYANEATKILNALNKTLWMADKGVWAEFKDKMGKGMLHENPAIWTIYHALDGGVADAEQAYLATRYIDNQIPHFTLEAKGLDIDKYSVISTSSWMPYSWSINNVAVAENYHTALAYWQSGRPDRAFNLYKSVVLDNMFMGQSPGNVGQISYYDAARGECYRDFGDPVGIGSRALVQGLFGIKPQLLDAKLLIEPGFPSEWNYASFSNTTISLDFRRENKTDYYSCIQQFKNLDSVEFILPVKYENIEYIFINGKNVEWSPVPDAIAQTKIKISTIASGAMNLEIKYSGDLLDLTVKEELAENGFHTRFEMVKQGQFEWIKPVHLNVRKNLVINTEFQSVDAANCLPIDISKYCNDSITNIFKNKYLSPRSPYTTLQLPLQGIGEWCHPNTTAEIKDSALRTGKLVLEKIPFNTVVAGQNVAFVSLWDNFPNEISIPLNRKASHLYLLMSGTTNHMQYKVPNAYIIAQYEDLREDTLVLQNPSNWAPIEQDYYVDGKAFSIEGLPPYRVQLNTGISGRNLGEKLGITGVYGRKIDGGAGLLLDFPVKSDKKIINLRVEAIANDVIVGLLGLTVQN